LVRTYIVYIYSMCGIVKQLTDWNCSSFRCVFAFPVRSQKQNARVHRSNSMKWTELGERWRLHTCVYLNTNINVSERNIYIPISDLCDSLCYWLLAEAADHQIAKTSASSSASEVQRSLNGKRWSLISAISQILRL